MSKGSKPADPKKTLWTEILGATAPNGDEKRSNAVQRKIGIWNYKLKDAQRLQRKVMALNAGPHRELYLWFSLSVYVCIHASLRSRCPPYVDMMNIYIYIYILYMFIIRHVF